MSSPCLQITNGILVKLLISILLLSFAIPVFADVLPQRAEALVESAIDHFREEIREMQNLEVKVTYHWENDIFQANAGRVGSEVIFRFYGGLLKAPMGEDEFLVVVCHELGHVVGGAPVREPYPHPKNTVEGQADYFVTSKCLRRLWANDDNRSAVGDRQVDPTIVNACSRSFGETNEAWLCQRALLASHLAYNTMYENTEPLNYDTPDASEVDQTRMSYPDPQCRIDTIFAGAQCLKSPWENFSFSSPIVGACLRSTDPIGARPRCWYKP